MKTEREPKCCSEFQRSLVSICLGLIIPATQAVDIPETVLIPAGSCQMGDHHDLGGREHRNDELPIRKITLNAFHMGKYEITVAQYCEFLNNTDLELRDGSVYLNDRLLCTTRQNSEYSRIGMDRSKFIVLDGKEEHPVTGIRWHGAAAYCNWLSTKQKLALCYSANWECNFSAEGYRLPSEEEWEYAGRGGLHSPYRIFPWGDDEDPAHANWPHSGDPYETGAEPFTTPVGFYDGSLQKKKDFNWPSPQSSYQTKDGSDGYGLFDMAGNVWEWCNGLYSQNSADTDTAKPMPDGLNYHVLRSGNWYNGHWGHSRVSNRNPGYFRGPRDPNHPYYHIGLRVVRNAADIPPVSDELKILGNNFQFTEGPAADARGNLCFTDIRANRIYSLPASAAEHSPPNTYQDFEVLRENTGGANGLYFDNNGNLVVCEGNNGRIASISPENKVTVLADEYKGSRFNKPNDLWIDPNGGIYFSDPCYGRVEKKQDGEHVYYLMPDQSGIIRVINDFVRPNGLIGTADGKMLYVADHGSKKIWKYSVKTDGTLTDKTLFARVASDGLTLDSRGNLYATQDSVLIFDSEGKQIGEIKTPNRPTNVTFGGPANRTLFITARTHLCSVQMNVRGMDRQIAKVGKIPARSFQPAGKPERRPPGPGKLPQGRPDKPWLLEHAKELDVDGDGAVARGEILDEAEKAFSMYDTNRDGVLSGAELKGRGIARSTMGGFVKLHSSELDSNNDGTITKSEMLNESAGLFDKSDKDRDGKVTDTDKQNRRQRPQDRGRGERARKPGGDGGRFAEIDSDNNGKISFQEFTARERQKRGRVDEVREKRKFEQIDRNGDGTISEQELTTAPRGRGGRG